MAEAELRGVISGDASDFVAASRTAQGALGKLTATGKQADRSLRSSFSGSVFSSLTSGLKGAGAVAGPVGAAISTAFNTATKAITAATVGLGAAATAVSAFGVGAVASFAKFQQSFSQVRTLVDESQVDVGRLADGVRDLSVAFGVDVVEATNAAYQAISAGQDPAGVVDFLRRSFEGAAAGAASVTETVDLFTSVLNTFEAQGVSAAQASDVLFTTVRLGKTTISELAASFGQVGPIAAAAGVSFDELGAALATTTAQGLNTAESATAIKAAIAGIVNPSESAAKALEGIGVNAQSLAEEGLVETFRKIGEATGGAVDRITQFLPNIRAVNAAAILAGNGLEKFAANASQTRDAVGAASTAFGKTADDITRNFNILRQTITDTFRGVGQALEPIASQLTKSFGAFAANTRNEFIALERVLGARLDQAAQSVEDLEEEVTQSSGAIVLGFRAIAALLDEVGTALDFIAGPAAKAGTILEQVGRIIKLNVVTAVAAASTALSVLVDALVFTVGAFARAQAGLLRVAGFRQQAAEVDSFRESLEASVSGLREFAAAARGEAGEALTDVFEGFVSAGARAGELELDLKDLARGARNAADDVRQFGDEVEEQRGKVERSKAPTIELGNAAKDAGDKAKSAAGGVKQLGDAAGGVEAPMGKAATATTQLGEALSRIAGQSQQAARGLADLGPQAEAIAKAITGIGTAQSEEQALAARQEAISSLIRAADAELEKRIDEASSRGQAQLKAARAALDAARAQEREALGTAGFAAASEEVARAQENLEAVTRRVNEAFQAEREAAQAAFEGVTQDILKLDGALEVFREESIRKAKDAGTAAIEEARRAFEAEEQRLRDARARGDLESEEFLAQAAENEQRLLESITAVGDRFVQERQRIQEAFDLNQETQQVNQLADALTGEFAAAVSQAREDAEALGFTQEELNEALGRIVNQAANTAEAFEGIGDAGEAAGEKIRAGTESLRASGQSTAEVIAGIKARADELGLSASQTQEALDDLANIGIERLRAAGDELGMSIVDLVTGGFVDLADSVTDLGERLDEDGREKLADLTDSFNEGQVSLEVYARGLLDVADQANLTGRELRDLIQAIEEQAQAAESAAQRAQSAISSFGRTGVGQRPGGETQAEVNQRFSGFGFGIQSNRTPTVAEVFSNLSPAQRNQVREQARQAGVTNDEEFTRFVVQNSPGLDPGGLSFDLGGPVRVDQLARLQAGERVLSRAQNAALGQLVQGFVGRVPSQQTINVSPTFNIEGGNAESFRDTARSLIPEITRATQLGVVGKSLL